MKPIEENFRFADGIPPLFILDYRVLAWKIFANTQTYRATLYPQKQCIDPRTGEVSWQLQDDGSRKAELERFIKLSWISVLNRGPDMLSATDATIVIVDDIKTTYSVPADLRKKSTESSEEMAEVFGYWRHIYLRDFWADYDPEVLPKTSPRSKTRHTHESLEYKGGRSEKTATWRSVADIGLSYITKKSPFPYLSLDGFEADDFAGAIVAAKLSGEYEVLRDREVFLYTIDRDWLQLVGDGTLWCNTARWEPRIRGVEETIIDVKKKERVTIKHPREIVDAKAKKGDKSDNLPAGTPREVIDLLNPPDAFNLRNFPIFEMIIAAANDPVPNNDLSSCETCLKMLRNSGLPMSTSFPYKTL